MRRIEGDPLSEVPENILGMVSGMIDKGARAHWEWRSSEQGGWMGYKKKESSIPLNAIDRNFIPDGTVIIELPTANIIHTDERANMVVVTKVGKLPCRYEKKL